jgi:subtilisin family serine protease
MEDQTPTWKRSRTQQNTRAGHKGGGVLAHHPHHRACFTFCTTLLLAALGASEAQAEPKGRGPPPGIGPPAFSSAFGSPGSGPDLPMGGGVGGAANAAPIANAVPIEGLYDRKRGAVSDTVKRNPHGSVDRIDRQVPGKAGNTKDQLGKGLAGPQTPRPSRVPPAGEQRFVATEVLVALPSNFTQQALDTLARRHRLVRLESQAIGLTGTTFHRWQITDQRSVADIVRALEADTGVRTAQPNYRFTLQQTQRQTANDFQYALEKLRLPEAHQLATGDSVLVAVIDNGIDTAHPEFAALIAGSFNATERPQPPAHHGTGITGTIAAHALLTGVAPAARILAIRAFAPTGKGDEDGSTSLALLKSIDWAVSNGARVINMSFAGPRDPELALAIAAAAKKGVVLVAAAGNAGPKSAPLYPAADPNVIAVTATDPDDKLFVRSSRGHHIAVAAPGVDILAPAPSDTYQIMTGTSVAAAQVSGIVALLLEARPSLTPQDVRKVLLSTARDLGPKGRDDQFGAGLADAYGAVESLMASPARAPVANVSTDR